MWNPPRTVTCPQIRRGQCGCQGQPGWNLVLDHWSKTAGLLPSLLLPSLQHPSTGLYVGNRGSDPLPISVLHLVAWVTKVH